MGQVRDVLVHVYVEVAERQRICHHNRKQHSITKGIACLAVYEADGGRKNYCLPCAEQILTKAKTKLAGFETQLKN
jgi:hypothetical protein